MSPSTRREFLQSIAVSGVVGLAGCNTESTTPSATPTEEVPSEGETPTRFESSSPTPPSTATPTGNPTEAPTPTPTDLTAPTDTATPAQTPTATATPTETPTPTPNNHLSPVGTFIPVGGDGDDGFGSAVALSESGSTGLFGAFWDEDPNGYKAGSTYVYERHKDSWIKSGKISANDGDVGDWFGSAIALSGDETTVLIGAPADDDPNGYEAGSAYVFQRQNGTWHQGAKVAASDGKKRANFGDAVSLSRNGKVSLLGAPGGEDADGTNTGAGYVFERHQGGWTQRTKLLADDGEEADLLGSTATLSEDGSRALLGAPQDEWKGSAYVFERSNDTWYQRTKLVARDRERYDFFGSTVELSSDGSTAFVGIENEERCSSGSVFVFERTSGTWEQQSELTPPEEGNDGQFGDSVSASGSGDVVIVGAPGITDSNRKSGGSAHVFDRTNGKWRHRARLATDDNSNERGFGEYVTLSRDASTALVWSHSNDSRGGNGAVFLFEL